MLLYLQSHFIGKTTVGGMSLNSQLNYKEKITACMMPIGSLTKYKWNITIGEISLHFQAKYKGKINACLMLLHLQSEYTGKYMYVGYYYIFSPSIKVIYLGCDISTTVQV